MLQAICLEQNSNTPVINKRNDISEAKMQYNHNIDG